MRIEEPNSTIGLCENDNTAAYDDELLHDSWNEPPPAGLINGRPLSVAAQERITKKMRDDLMYYFNNEGAVEWQAAKINE